MAEEPAISIPAASRLDKPLVEQLDPHRFRINTLLVDCSTREIRFPTKVNMTEGLLEFIMVTPKGKVHESLLVTDLSPSQLNFAFILLSYKPSAELFPRLDEIGRTSGSYPEVPAEIKNAARIAIDVEWTDLEGKVHRHPINEWIQHRSHRTAMPSGPWLYTGAGVSQGKYIPDLTGDVAAIFVEQNALINYPGKAGDDDTNWFAFPNRIPPKDTPVTVIISPYSKSN
jgi:hypothetical protein